MSNDQNNNTQHQERSAHVGRYVLIGALTVAPLWITWLVFEFVLKMLAQMGEPLLRGLARAVRPHSDTIANWLLDSSFQQGVAALLTIAGLYGIGLLASFVIGKKVIDLYEDILARLPLVQTIYGATKRFLNTLSKPPVTGRRVVLINFPSSEMKAIGFITKVLHDTETGEKLAAVYVPTSPNPTSGYIEIVPIKNIIMTDWSTEEAMTFVVTGGTNSPEKIHFSSPDNITRDMHKGSD
ncbi:Uncharacterized membrane protein [Nitrosomonas marina]|uniref:Uncharacterized membrane protein n=1 Tax=Nitrosomonas marina TaxID=917 RepID=A0A1I0CMD6_9PROT|nr:DUF502 domain-containing protein [Nitrosomonas marina]SET20148.1 Uncharacterized membrane protein [Nitrosomonas marina]